jgi:hypothetical protein
VTPEYRPPFEFNGKIHSVTIDVSGELIGDKEVQKESGTAHGSWHANKLLRLPLQRRKPPAPVINMVPGSGAGYSYKSSSTVVQ